MRRRDVVEAEDRCHVACTFDDVLCPWSFRHSEHPGKKTKKQNKKKKLFTVVILKYRLIQILENTAVQMKNG